MRTSSDSKIRRRVLLVASVLACGAPPLLHAAPAALPHTAGAYATAHYPNLFAQAGHSDAEVHAKIERAYQQLFHGDPESQSLVFAAGRNANGPLSYLTDWASKDVRTEGMSYGMMIAVQLDKKADFDALWNWAKTYMYISDPGHPAYGYFAWSCKTTGQTNEETPAPDGEEYFTMALLFAANRWGSGTGIYNYKEQAEQLLHTMLHREEKEGTTPYGPRTVAAEFSTEHDMVLFVPSVTPHPFTDPSYHLPAFYELWSLWGPPEDKAFWHHAAEVSRQFFVKSTDPKTGLAPSYANFDGTPHQTRFPQSGEFGYDAWRTASNWSVDWSWWHAAPEEQVLSNRIQAFFASQGISSYGPVYTLNGTPEGATPGLTPEGHPTGLVGTNAVASLAATDKQRAALFVDALWQAPIPDGHSRYYDGMLYLMSMMHVGGEFRVWKPK